MSKRLKYSIVGGLLSSFFAAVIWYFLIFYGVMVYESPLEAVLLFSAVGFLSAFISSYMFTYRKS